MNPSDTPLVWLHGEIKTPPFGEQVRIEAGVLLRCLQKGELLSPPHSRPMPAIGERCHELRIRDREKDWRIVYRLDPDAIVIAEIFTRTTKQTSQRVVDACKRRFRRYDELVGG